MSIEEKRDAMPRIHKTNVHINTCMETDTLTA